MIQKKICLLGASGVGKTSLVRRIVESVFDDKYLTTIGVKVDKKAVTVGSETVMFMLWDIAGAEEHFTVPSTYVRGAAGFLLVIDASRPETVGAAHDLVLQVRRDIGPLPHIVVVNKTDLAHLTIEPDAIGPGIAAVVRTSAKTGEGVEEAFQRLAELVTQS